MNNHIKIIFLFLLLSVSLNAQKISSFQWMEGSWMIDTGRSIILETWKVKNDSTLTGQSMFIAGKDTMPQEKIELAFRGGSWYYHPILNGQNESHSTRFKIIMVKGSEFISENSEHDFPQRISYRRIKDQMFASIEGKNAGKYMKENFDFIKK